MLVPATLVPSAYQLLLAPVRALHRVAPDFSRAFAEIFEGRSEGMGDVRALELLTTAMALAVQVHGQPPSASSK